MKLADQMLDSDDLSDPQRFEIAAHLRILQNYCKERGLRIDCDARQDLIYLGPTAPLQLFSEDFPSTVSWLVHDLAGIFRLSGQFLRALDLIEVALHTPAIRSKLS